MYIIIILHKLLSNDKIQFNLYYTIAMLLLTILQLHKTQTKTKTIQNKHGGIFVRDFQL